MRVVSGAVLIGSLLLVSPLPCAADDNPDLKISPGSVSFGQVAGSKSKHVQIRNNGASILVITAISRCGGTSPEFGFMPGSGTVASKKKLDLTLVYTPVDEGSDEGCIELASNDPDTPLAQVAVKGTAKASSGPPPSDSAGFRLQPSRFDFGVVDLGSASRKTARVRTKGGARVSNVVLNRCAGTSAEYSFLPQTAFEVVPGQGALIEVTYAPMDNSLDQGCLEVTTVGSTDEPDLLSLSGSGGEPFDGVDLVIDKFKVRKEVKLDLGQSTAVQMWVRNVAELDEPRTASVVGEQNGAVVYNEQLEVEDQPGNSGLTKFRFPKFQPTGAGDVVWTAEVADDDFVDDVWTAVTRVTSRTTGTSSGVDLDISRFHASRSADVSQGSSIHLRAWVQNNGDDDQERPATLIGVQNGTEVYAETIDVSDTPGNSGSTRYDFPKFTPTANGDVLWLLVIDDDDPDMDEAFGSSRVVS